MYETCTLPTELLKRLDRFIKVFIDPEIHMYLGLLIEHEKEEPIYSLMPSILHTGRYVTIEDQNYCHY